MVMNFLKKHWKLVVVVLMVLIGIGVAALMKFNPLAALNPSQEKTVTVSRRDLEQTVSMSGTIEAEKKVTLRFQIAGLLAWVGIKVGDSVSAGQVIATLDQRELHKKLQKTLNTYLDTRWDYDQTRDDNEGGYTGSGNTYITDEITRIAQQAQFDLDSSVIDVELADLSLQLSRLSTPIAGVVTKVDQPYAGVNITPAQAEFIVVDPETIYLKAVVDQQDVVLMHAGDKADVVFDAYPEESTKGTITYIGFAPEVGEENSYEVRVMLPQRIFSKLKMGMSAEVNVVTQRKHRVIAVPIEAIQDGTGGRSYVMVKTSSDQTKKRPIQTGIETFEYVQVTGGLKEGEVIVY